MHIKFSDDDLEHGALPGSESTLCGLSFDNLPDDVSYKPVPRQPVTCARCLVQAKINESAIADILGKLEKVK